MKKTLKISGIVIGVIFLILLITPFLFKGKAERIAKEEINKQLNANVNWDSFNLSLLKDFPNLSIGMDYLSIVGVEKFDQDTLLSINKFSVSVDLMSVISGSGVHVESFLLKDPVVHAKVLADSTVNWDIMKATEETLEDPVDTTSSNFTINLKQFAIENATITYSDATMDLDMGIGDLNMELFGDFSAESTELNVKSSIEKVDFSMEGVQYLHNLKVGLDADLLADLNNMIFTFKENDLMLNQLNLGFDGFVTLLDEGYDMDIKLATKQTDFKAILGLVPEVFMADLSNIKTKGTLKLESEAKGIYIDENNLPAFSALLKVDNGQIKYPDLPKSIDNININVQVQNEGGSPDNTITEVKSFHFELADNPFDANILVKNPISNMQFVGGLLGTIDLGSVKDAIPLDSVEIRGIVDADFSIDGNMDMVEKEQYEKVKSTGKISLDKFFYDSPDLPDAVNISSASISFTPTAITLDKFDCIVSQSDFSLQGEIKNYLAYALNDKILYGKLNHQSKYINVNEFLIDETGQGEEVEDTTALELIEIPENLDLVFTSSIDKLLYDKLEITNAIGKITIRNGAVSLDGMGMNLLDGQLTMKGQYNTQNVSKPFVDFFFSANDIDITKTANSFSVIDSLMPIAKKSKGQITADLKYNSVIDNAMSPIISSITGGGNIKSNSIQVSHSKVLNGMASLLKNDKYKTMTAEDIDIDFIMKDGKIIISPFTPKVFGKTITVKGEQGFDQSLNYIVQTPISRSEVAGALSFMGGGFSNAGEDLLVDVIIKGTAKDPKMSLDVSKATKQVQKEVGKEAEKIIKDVMKDENVKKTVDDLRKKLGF